MEINGNIINLGENKTLKIRVGKLPSGTSISIVSHIFRSKNEGKTILLLGGIHGDEINGMEIIRRAIEKQYFDNLQCGTVIAIPVLNIFGFINFNRDLPSGKDLNRSFPGSEKGSLAARVARKFTKFFLPYADIIIDFHTGGDIRYNYPQIRYSNINDESIHISKIFNAPFIIQKAMIPKSLRKTAVEMGKAAIVYEAGESKRLDEFSISTGLQGIRNVLQYFEMIDKQEIELVNSKFFNKTSWIRARDSGILNLLKHAGDDISEKEILAVIKDISNEWSKNVRARRSGSIIGHNNAPVINMGDPIYHVAWYDEE